MLNAKTQRPGVCNAAETLLVHEGCAAEFVPRIARALGTPAWSCAATSVHELALASGGLGGPTGAERRRGRSRRPTRRTGARSTWR